MKNLTILKKFKDLFGCDNPMIFIAPGRINIIGEHTDYNDGYVLPAAIDKAMEFALKANGKDTLCRVFAIDLNEYYEFDLSKLEPKKGFWSTYIMGVCNELLKKGYKIKGFDMVFGGDIPLGAGLSSSAALECGVATALNDIFSLGIEKMDIAKIGQNAEHNYAGVKCGIMDQFASVMGKKNHVIRLDCRSMEYQYFPLELGEYIVVLCDTNVKHELASSEYNTRRKECEEGLKICNKLFGVKSLRDVNIKMLEDNKDMFPSDVYKRIYYVVGEVIRVETACEKMKQGDIEQVGKMMYLTHDGLSKEYQVSCPELDFLVDLTRDDKNVIGSRVMGGGFGGCTINIVKENYADEFIKKASTAYKEKFNIDMKAYKTKVTDGCRKQ